MPVVASFAVPHPPLIVKEVGKGAENEVKLTIESYEKVADEIAKLEPETIVISSPHTLCLKDYFYLSSEPIMSGSFASFGASSVSFQEEIDTELVQEIERIANEHHFPAGTLQRKVELDHGTMVPLYFIRKKYPHCKIIVIGLSAYSLEKHYELGTIIQEAIDKLNRKVVYVASGDLSHKLQITGPYGFAKEGAEYEELIQNTMTNANFQELIHYDQELLDKAAECGHPSFSIMAGVWKNKQVKPTFLSHEDITGVGYGLWTYYPIEDEYVSLAKKTIETYVKEKKTISVPKNTSEELLKKRSGVFVSIHKFGELRGCIGTFLPTQNSIAEEIIENAIHASTLDPRFQPITAEELNDLEINVDVLTEPENISSMTELDPKKYGVIVYHGFRKGLLLPDLDGIDTPEIQVEIAKKKAGIKPDEIVSLQRFEVVRHK